MVCESVPTSESGKATAWPSCLFAEDDAGEIFEIDLVADAGVRRNYLEILKTFLAPAQESVTLDIALHFEVGVEGEGAGDAEFVHLDGVVNHQFSGEQRIDFFWFAAELAHGFAHRGEIHYCGNAGEILKQHAGGHERDFFFGGALGARGIPGGQRADVFIENEAAVFVAEQVFEEDFQGKRKARDVADAGAFERGKVVDFEGVAANVEFGARAEGVFGLGAHARVAAPVI